MKILYIQNKESIFTEQLKDLIKQGEIHPVTGSLACRSALRCGIEKQNLFCKDPLNYVLNSDLRDHYDFDNIFIKTVQFQLNDKNYWRMDTKLMKIISIGERYNKRNSKKYTDRS